VLTCLVEHNKGRMRCQNNNNLSNFGLFIEPVGFLAENLVPVCGEQLDWLTDTKQKQGC